MDYKWFQCQNTGIGLFHWLSWKGIRVDYTVIKHCSDDEDGRLGRLQLVRQRSAIELFQTAEAILMRIILCKRNGPKSGLEEIESIRNVLVHR